MCCGKAFVGFRPAPFCAGWFSTELVSCLCASVASQTRSTSQPVESEVSEEQEQNTIARALAYVHSKEEKPTSTGPDCQPIQQLGPWQHPLTTKIASPRVKVVAIHEGGAQSGGARHYRSRAWSPGDLVTDQGLVHKPAINQQHSKMLVRAAPNCQSIVARPQYPSVSGSGASMAREAVGANRLMTRSSLIQARSLEGRGSKEIVEGSFLIDEHCQDDEEWLHSDRRKVNAIGTSSEMKPSNAGRPSTCGSYNPMMWARDSQWWNWQSSQLQSAQRGHMPYAGPSLAPPVCVRSMVAVHASPPASRVSPDEAGSISTEGEQTTRQVLCQLKL